MQASVSGSVGDMYIKTCVMRPKKMGRMQTTRVYLQEQQSRNFHAFIISLKS